VLWQLEELGLEYEVQHYLRDPNTLLAPPQLRTVHPLGKSPVVTDEGRTLAESGAILEYLNERHGDGKFVPTPGTAESIRYRYWMHYAEGSAMPPLLLKLVFERVAKGPLPLLIRPVARAISRKVIAQYVQPQLELHYDFMEGELGNSPWFAGEAFTAADIQMSYPLEAAVSRGGLDAKRPALWNFVQRIRERPAYQRAIERGGSAVALDSD
jgi:glutathione S-transferase